MPRGAVASRRQRGWFGCGVGAEEGGRALLIGHRGSRVNLWLLAVGGCDAIQRLCMGRLGDSVVVQRNGRRYGLLRRERLGGIGGRSIRCAPHCRVNRHY